VGLSTLAVAVGEEPETVEVVAEPFLVRKGLIARTPRGRIATPAAWRHLGLAPPPTAEGTLFEVEEEGRGLLGVRVRHVVAGVSGTPLHSGAWSPSVDDAPSRREIAGG